ncbi:MAG: MarR family transcriptional regulator [Parachlamydiaceae bacterium]|nr:MarR family transcriptional regulator [Parachlamydiaceae bacterium]
MTKVLPKKKFLSLAEEAANNIERTGWLAHNKLEEFMKPYAITPQQLNVISILIIAKGSLPTLEIGRRMIQKLPDISRLIDRLEKLGYVYRERSVEDRRIVIVHITPQGAEIADSIFKPMSAAASRYLSHMTDSELTQLIYLLEKVRQGEQE